MRFDAMTYPGRPPAQPTLVWRGQTYPVSAQGDVAGPVSVPPAAAGAPVLEPGVVRWTVAYGANADPDRVVDKGLDINGALVLPARLRGYRRVWEARRSTSTGAVPLTLQPAAGIELATFVVGVHADDARVLDATEGRGTDYALGRVGPVAVAARFLLPDALAYGPTAGTRLLTVGSAPAVYPAVGQARASALLDEPMTVRLGAEGLPRPVAGAWPATPLEDLPLLVYGTLQPGGSRWDLISELVEVVGDASLPGRMTATHDGYPAVDLTAPGIAHGALLRARDPRAARELVERTDAIEDAPDLFRRTVATVRHSGQRLWAIAYEWNPDRGDPPGTVIPDGRWLTPSR